MRPPLTDGLGHATRSATQYTSTVAQASCVIVIGFRAALDLETYPFSHLFFQGALNGLNLVEVNYAYWLFRLFSRHIFRTQPLQQNRHISFHASVALKLLVSLISRLVACSARIVVDRQTDRHVCNLEYINRWYQRYICIYAVLH